ncbi:MAG: ribbon-helix-helix protein, CopG family [Thermodesulfobacteriota bacterium]
MKSRTMVYLEPEQLQSLQKEARNQRISLAELMRRLVKTHLTKDKGVPKASQEVYLKIVGMGSSGKKDISDNHDRYLGKAVRREHAR